MANVKYYNLVGGLNTVQGIGTINQSPKKTESPDMQNVEYHLLGGIQSMLGNKLFGNSNFDSKITLGYEYIYQSDNYMIVTTAKGGVYIYNPASGGFDLIYTFAHPSERHSICSFNNGLVISNGIDDLVYYQRGRHQQLTGTVTIQADATTVTGENTQFKTELNVGDTIQIGNDTETIYTVTEISSDTQMTIDKAPTAIIADEPIYLGEISQCNATLTNSKDENINTPIRGLAMNSYRGRIFVGSTDGTLYYSAVGLYNNWDIANDAGGISTFYDDNSDFTALAIYDKYLVLCKRERSYLLNGVSSNSAEWTIEPYSIYTCDSQQSWIDCNGGLYMFSRVAGGIYPILQRTIYNPNYQGNELSTKIKESFKYVNAALYDYIFPVYHPKKMYLMFYIPMLTGRGSNTAYVFDLLTKSWLLRKVPQEVTVAFRFEDEIYIGTADGKIYKEFQGLTFDGQPIEFWWKSPWFSFGQGTDYLSTRELRLKLSEEQTNKFKLRNSRNGSNLFKERLIDSGRGAFTGLEWDIGYNPNEQNPTYSSLKASYPITNNTNNTTYYTDTLLTNVNGFPVREGVPIYSDVNCTELLTYTGLDTYEYQTNDPQLADRIQRIPVDGYEWQYSYQEYVRYTNGTDYLWVFYQDGHPQVGRACKVSKQASTTLSMYAYYGRDTNNRSQFKTVYLRPTDTPNVTHNRIGCYEARNADGSFAGQQLLLRGSLSNPDYHYIIVSGHIYESGRWSSNDIYEATGTDTGSDLDSATSTVITAANETTDDVWTVTAGGATFAGLNSYTFDGETVTGNLYSKTNTIENGTDLYGNTECTSHAAEGRAPDDTGNIVLLDGFARQVRITGGTQYNFFDYQYFVKEQVFYNYQMSEDGNGLTYSAYVFNNIALYDPDNMSNYISIDVTSLEPPKAGDTVEVHTGETVTNEQIVSITGLETEDVVLVTNENTYSYKQYESATLRTDSYQTNIYLNNNKAYLDINNKRYIGDVVDKVIKPSWCYQRLGWFRYDALRIEKINDPTKIQLPDLSNYKEETLTDTVWDEDSWVVSNHIVKRFPLPDQFFNTMQITFYGNAADEALALYGFEIDGVELEEVPYR